jgi:diguanylate cyclase (GGDEF)-like protein
VILKAGTVGADANRVIESRPLNLSGDERVLAGKLGGALWLAALPMAALGLGIPGISGRHPTLALAVAVAATVWGVLAVFVIPWRRAGAIPFHVLAALGVVAMSAMVAATGGGPSPLWPGFFLIVAYCSYFYPAGQAILYVSVCALAMALPYVYYPATVEPSFLGEIAMAGAAYVAVAGVILLGKRQLIALRDVAEHLSLHDPLTELPNRRVLRYELDKRLASRDQQSVALFLVDLDNFKDVNSLHGHPGGDAALRAVAKALAGAVRPEDTAARLGGDEFAVLASGSDEEQLASVPERLIDAVVNEAQLLDLPGVTLGASVGWARHPQDATDADELIAAADVSLRAAKTLGKGIARSPLDWSSEPQTARV